MRRGEAPNVFGYLAYREFLRDWSTSRKAADPRWSHRAFARRAGVGSPSLLNEVIQGKRNLTPATCAGFLTALGLDAAGSAFFRELVDLDQAESPAERREVWERIAASRRFRAARPIDGATWSYLSRWWVPAVRELAHRADFRPDPDWIARTLLPRVTPAEARQALDTLLQLGLLAEREGRLRPAEVSLATPHQVAGLAANAYHEQMLDRAREAVSAIPSRERHVIGVTVAIPERLIPELKRELDRMQERLLHLCDEHVADAERVYQLELALVPLSRGTEER